MDEVGGKVLRLFGRLDLGLRLTVRLENSLLVWLDDTFKC